MYYMISDDTLRSIPSDRDLIMQCDIKDRNTQFNILEQKNPGKSYKIMI